MKRTNVLELKPSKTQKKILNELLIRSSSVYNLGNYKKRQVFLSNQKTGERTKIPSAIMLQKELKTHDDYKKLGSGYSQQILNKLQENWNSYFKSIKSKKIKHKVSIPKYKKNRKTNTTIPSLIRCRNDLYSIDREYVSIPCPKDLKQKYNIKSKKLMKIKTKGILRWKGKKGHCEIIYDIPTKKYYLNQVISEVEKKGHVNKYNKKIVYENLKTVKKSSKIASIDLGIKRLISTLVEGNCYLFDIQKKFNEYQQMCLKYNKYKSILNSEWQDTKGKPLLNTSKRLKKISNKKRLQLDHLQNCIVKQVFDTYLKNDINTVVIGDISNIRETYHKNKYNHKTNQMINNFWSFGKLMEKIKCKAEEHNIKIIEMFEGYTSSLCPFDKKHKVMISDRDFFCFDCGKMYDRDAVGCMNILNNYIKGMVETRPNLSVIEM